MDNFLSNLNTSEYAVAIKSTGVRLLMETQRNGSIDVCVFKGMPSAPQLLVVAFSARQCEYLQAFLRNEFIFQEGLFKLWKVRPE